MRAQGNNHDRRTGKDAARLLAVGWPRCIGRRTRPFWAAGRTHEHRLWQHRRVSRWRCYRLGCDRYMPVHHAALLHGFSTGAGNVADAFCGCIARRCIPRQFFASGGDANAAGYRCLEVADRTVRTFRNDLGGRACSRSWLKRKRYRADASWRCPPGRSPATGRAPTRPSPRAPPPPRCRTPCPRGDGPARTPSWRRRTR